MPFITTVKESIEHLLVSYFEGKKVSYWDGKDSKHVNDEDLYTYLHIYLDYLLN